MGSLRQKQPRLVLNEEAYDQLKKHVLNRDGWKCQDCGTSANLQVHHLVYRSQLGPDESTNLISLCARCHRRRHNNLFHKRNIGYCVKDRSGKIYL
jgi:5-methylcytosine-specific restriction endonuclease McrA